MSPQLQRIAIAEQVGWRIENYGPRGYEKLYWRLRRPDGTIRCDECTGEDWSRAVFAAMLPDYLADLNACHEMEKVLLKVTRHAVDYWMTLANIVERDNDTVSLDDGKMPMMYVHATAAQRCEAFLKTLAKWSPAARDEGRGGKC